MVCSELPVTTRSRSPPEPGQHLPDPKILNRSTLAESIIPSFHANRPTNNVKNLLIRDICIHTHKLVLHINYTRVSCFYCRHQKTVALDSFEVVV